LPIVVIRSSISVPSNETEFFVIVDRVAATVPDQAVAASSGMTPFTVAATACGHALRVADPWKGITFAEGVTGEQLLKAGATARERELRRAPLVLVTSSLLGAGLAIERMSTEIARKSDATEPLRAHLADVALAVWTTRCALGTRMTEPDTLGPDGDVCAWLTVHNATGRLLDAASEIVHARVGHAPEAARLLCASTDSVRSLLDAMCQAFGSPTRHRRALGASALGSDPTRDAEHDNPLLDPNFARTCETEITSRAASHDATAHVSDEARTALQSAGYAAAFFSKDLGGRGGDAAQTMATMECLATACSGAYWQATASALLYGKAVASLASPEQRTRWLAPVVSGEAIASFALAKVGSTADLGSIRAVVRRHGPGYRLSGLKQPITNVVNARVALVLARREVSEPDAAMCFALVDLSRPGVARRAIAGTGLRAATWGVLEFDEYELGADEVFDATPDVVLAATAWGQLAVAVGALGVLRRAVQSSVRHLRSRSIFEGTLGDIASVQGQVGALIADTFTLRALVARATWAISGAPHGPSAWKAKVLATEVAQDAAMRAIAFQGAAGLVSGTTAERGYRDAAMFVHASMSNDRLRDILANVALGKAPFSSPLAMSRSHKSKERNGVAKRFLVTGATGFIGGHIAAHLAARGDHVRAFVRKTSRVDKLVSLGIELAYGDLTDAESLTAACKGMDGVIHNAAPVGTYGEWEHYLEEGVRGTERVLQGAIKSDARRFIFMSSIAVYGFRPHGRALSEDFPLDRSPQPWNHYVREKVMCEDLLWDAHKKGDIVLTSIRPSCVFGPGDRNIVPRMVGLLNLPVLVLPGRPGNRVPAVTIDDLVGATVCAIDEDVSHGRSYNISGASPLTQHEAFDLVATAAKIDSKWFNAPTSLFYRPVGVLEKVWAGTKLPGEPPTTRGAIALFGYDYEIDISRAVAELGFKGESSYGNSIRASLS
jgi:nucleoside-diphosphate-sugar epimerase/alkylation response protein AidB-like acyl-CoA dehydrogenase